MTRHIHRLERRRLLSAVAPTDIEQYMVELINRARAHPAAEASMFGIDLNEGLAPGTITTDPKQPLAINFNLDDAALGHSQDMLANQIFQHAGSNGSSPGDRIAAAGYDLSGNFKWEENIAWDGTTGTPDATTFVTEEHKDLFIDSGIPDRGHRTNLLDPSVKEIGVGIATGLYDPDPNNPTKYNAVIQTDDFAFSGSASFLTGVAYVDSDHNNFYTPGEGLAGITITATNVSDNSVAGTTTTFSTGGYTLQLPPGTYNVTASGGTLAQAMVTNNITITTQNVEVDFVPASSTGSTGTTGTGNTGTTGTTGTGNTGTTGTTGTGNTGTTGTTGTGNTGTTGTLAALSAIFSGKPIASLKPAQSAKLTAIIKIISSAAITNKSNLSLYLSTDQQLDSSDLLLTSSSASAIAVGKTTKANFSFKSPLTLPDGNYFFLVSSGSTQIGSSTAPTHIIAPTANFTASLSKLKKSYSAGGALALSAKIKNTGNYTASSNLTYSFMLQSTTGGSPINLGSSSPLSLTLKSNGTANYKTTLTLPADLAKGSYQLVMTLTSTTPETRTDDNTSISSIFTV